MSVTTKRVEAMARGREGIRALLAGSLTLGCAVTFSVAGAAPAHAAGLSAPGSIMYVKNHDVWTTTPNAATTRQITHNGATATSDSTGGVGYGAPSESDDGTIVVAVRNQRYSPGYALGWIYVMNSAGGVVHRFRPPQLTFIADSGAPCAVKADQVPLGISNAIVSPDGRHIAYESDALEQLIGGCQTVTAYSSYVINIDGTGGHLITRAGTTNGAYLEPGQWSGNTRFFVDDLQFGSVQTFYVDLPGTGAKSWTEPSDFIDSAYGQAALRAGKLATVGYSEYNSGRVMRLWTSSGPPSAPVARCEDTVSGVESDAFATRPTWAPDGSAVAYQIDDGTVNETGEGVYLEAVPSLSNCGALHRSLFIAGGDDPFWSPAPVTPPMLRVNDVSKAEGNSGSSSVRFTITRTGSTSSTSSVTVATADGTANAGSDYLAVAPKVITFAPGRTSASVDVRIIGDTGYEPNEAFSLRLTSAHGAVVADGYGAGTIVNDDPRPAAGSYQPIPRAKVLDTRLGVGTPKRALAAHGTLRVLVTGHGVPVGARSVWLDVRVVGNAASGSVIAYPDGTARTSVAAFMFTAGKSASQLIQARVGADGRVDLYNNSAAAIHLEAAVSGWTAGGTATAGGTVRTGAPRRVLDTRTGLGAPRRAVAARGTLHVSVPGAPTGARAVMVTVTAMSATRSGSLVVWADRAARPAVTTLAFLAGRITSGAVLARIGSDRRIAIYNGSSGTVALSVDVTGYVLGGSATVGGALVTTNPVRALDTRVGFNAARRALGRSAAITVPVAGHFGVPRGVRAVVLALTALSPTGSGQVIAWPHGVVRPSTADLTVLAREMTSNLVVVPVGTDGRIALWNATSGTVQLIASLYGYYRN